MGDPYAGWDPFRPRRRRWFRRVRSRTPQVPQMPDWTDHRTGAPPARREGQPAAEASRAIVIAIALALVVLGLAVAMLAATVGDGTP